jgi:RimJ/RimL family protein N-acetyltransferase
MLRGELVGLRARHEADVPILDSELHGDVLHTVRSGRAPWRPLVPGAQASRYRIVEPNDTFAPFSVVELTSGTLAGAAVLGDIDTHGRSAGLGLALRPSCRGKGLATDIVRVLCHYGFSVLGLHRLRVETLADNQPMLKAAERAGFRREALLRDAGWIMGRFLDEVVLGLLADEWVPA